MHVFTGLSTVKRQSWEAPSRAACRSVLFQMIPAEIFYFRCGRCSTSISSNVPVVPATIPRVLKFGQDAYPVEGRLICKLVSAAEFLRSCGVGTLSSSGTGFETSSENMAPCPALVANPKISTSYMERTKVSGRRKRGAQPGGQRPISARGLPVSTVCACFVSGLVVHRCAVSAASIRYP